MYTFVGRIVGKRQTVLGLSICFLLASMPVFPEEIVVDHLDVGSSRGGMDHLLGKIEGDLLSGAEPTIESRMRLLDAMINPYGLRTKSFTSQLPISPEFSESFGALISAIIVHSIETWRRNGEVDMNSILLLLDSMDLYVGLSGAALGRFVFGKAGVWAVSGAKVALSKFEFAEAIAKRYRAAKASPGTFGRMVNLPTTIQLIEFLKGFSKYAMFMGGIELFAEYWDTATREIDGAHRLSKVINDRHVRNAVTLSLLFYTLIDKNKQQQILQRAFANRLMSFDFISLTLAMYCGGKAGIWLASKATKNPWALGAAGALGGVAGAAVQGVIPRGVRNSANAHLDGFKIVRTKSRMVDILKVIRKGVEAGSYPTAGYDDLNNRRDGEAYFNRFLGNELTYDLNVLRRTRDLLFGLYFKQYVEYAYVRAQAELTGARMEPDASNHLRQIEIQIAGVFRAEALFLKSALDGLVSPFDFNSIYAQNLKNLGDSQAALDRTIELQKDHFRRPEATYEKMLRHYLESSAKDYLLISVLIQSKEFLRDILLQIRGQGSE